MNSKRSLNPALGYNRFSEIVREAEVTIIAESPSLVGYDPKAVGQRLLQRIVELGLPPFLQDCAARQRQGKTAMPADGEKFECGGLSFDTGTRRITIRPGMWVKSLLEFGIQWLRVLAVVTRSASGNSSAARRKATLLFGVGVDDILLPGNDRRFLDFCRSGPITPLRNSERLIVECVKKAASTNPEYCSYAKHPLFKLASEYPARGFAWVLFLGFHLGNAMQFFAACIRHPIAAILSRDAAFHTLLSYLDRAGSIDSVIITNSHYHVQPLWMRALPKRKFTSHMVWYSQNSIPLTYQFDGIRSYLPNHRYIEADNIWVWTPGFRNYLSERGARGEIHVVGSILWYLPEIDRNAEISRGAIAVFDVTPLKSHLTDQIGLTYNYYQTKNALAFIAGIIKARDEIKTTEGMATTIFLKHKRIFSPHHEKAYLDFIEDANRSGLIQTVSMGTNLYTLIAEAAAVVVIPYSSPAYVAAELGIPAIYYDPTNELVPTHEVLPSIHFVAGHEALSVALYTALKRAATTPRQP